VLKLTCCYENDRLCSKIVIQNREKELTHDVSRFGAVFSLSSMIVAFYFFDQNCIGVLKTSRPLETFSNAHLVYVYDLENTRKIMVML
jgi:hypothetical protein